MTKSILAKYEQTIEWLHSELEIERVASKVPSFEIERGDKIELK